VKGMCEVDSYMLSMLEEIHVLELEEARATGYRQAMAENAPTGRIFTKIRVVDTGIMALVALVLPAMALAYTYTN